MEKHKEAMIPERGTQYDIFISYRRAGGAQFARILQLMLQQRGYNVFLDYDELTSGKFGEHIVAAIKEAPIFMIVLSKNAMEGCKNEDDWVRREIITAMSEGKQIVPVNPDNSFDGVPDGIPEDVKEAVETHQHSDINFGQTLGVTVDFMIDKRIAPVVGKRTKTEHVDTGFDAAKQSLEKMEGERSLGSRVLNSKVMIWIAIIGTILGIVGFVLPYISGHNQSEFSVSLNYHNREMQVGQSDTLIPAVKPEDGVFEYTWKSDNETAAMVSSTGVVRLLEEGSATITLSVKDKKGKSVQDSCLYIVSPAGSHKGSSRKAGNPVTSANTPEYDNANGLPSQTQSGSSTLNLGYASYDGDTRDGQPHGNGTLTFNTTHLIPGTVDCMANDGEKVIGSFREGKVNLGTWYRSDGTRLMVKLGQRYGN